MNYDDVYAELADRLIAVALEPGPNESPDASAVVAALRNPAPADTGRFAANGVSPASGLARRK